MKIHFSKNITVLRKVNGMTKADLGGQLKVRAKTVAAWENKIHYPESLMLVKIAAFFEVKISDLLFERFTL